MMMSNELPDLNKPRLLVMAGPTASGKSAIALELAIRFNGVIINADSMQVYRDLRVLTARPSVQDEAQIPHELYGFQPSLEPYSTGKWLEAVGALLDRLKAKNHLVIITGGTGLYFKALQDGLSPVPEIGQDIRDNLRKRAKAEGSRDLYEELRKLDPETAKRLKPGDGQRIVRALEVVLSTGKTLHQWQKEPGKSLFEGWDIARAVLMPEREALYQRSNIRFDHMIEQGALEEVQALGALKLASDLPVMKALGVKQLLAYIGGEIELEQALDEAKRDTRRYAKRQMTWFRGQMSDWPNFTPDAALNEISAIIS